MTPAILSVLLTVLAVGADTPPAPIVAVDWERGTVSVTARSHAAEFTGVRGAVPTAGLRVTRAGGSVTVAGPAAALLAVLTPGTRSLALRAGADLPDFRIDLPALDLGVPTLAADPDRAGGFLLSVPVLSSLPGVELRLAPWSADSLEPGAARVLSSRASDPYSLAMLSPAGDPAVFRVRLPKAEGEAPLTIVLQAAGPEGSLSSVVAVTFSGGMLGKIKVLRAARPAPTAEPVEMPECVLLTADAADAACAAAGVKPVWYNAAQRRELTEVERAAATVLAQGVPAGRACNRGEMLLLIAVEERPVELPTRLADAAGIEVDADVRLGLTPPAPPSRFGLAVDSSPAADVDGAIAGDDPRVVLPAAELIVIDPSRRAADAVVASQIRGVLDRAGRAGSENPLSAAVRGADANEAALSEGLRTAVTLADLPIEKTFDDVSTALGLELGAGDKAAVLTAWRRDAGRLPVFAIDRNGDGRIADDLAIAIIELLWKLKKYDPVTHFQVVPGTGGWIAVLPAKPLPLGFANGVQLLPPPPAPARVPVGPSVAAGSSSPDLARVPDVAANERVAEYAARLRSRGLKLKLSQAKVIGGDPVAGVEPGERAWVPAGSAVAVAVNRRTPGVVGKTFAEASKILGERELTPQPTIAGLTPAANDVIAEQRPREGEPSTEHGRVYVRIRRAVPDLVGKPARDAAATLRELRFEPDHVDRLAIDDTVYAQEPAAGETAVLNSRVVLVIRRPVPHVVGLKYPDAVFKLRSAGWRVKNPADFVGSAEWVLAQGIAVGKMAQLFPDFDTARLEIELTPGVRVPNLLDRTPAAAVELLKAAGLKAVYERPDSAFWKVEKHAPAAEELVALGAAVTLTLKETGKVVPPVVGLPTDQAKADLAGRGLATAFDPEPHAGEVVVAQNPASGARIDPAVAVKLRPGYKVPNLRDRTLADAKAAVEAAGGSLAPNPQEEVVPAQAAADDGKTEIRTQAPEASVLAERGAAVVVTVARYRYQDPRLKVPQFIRMTETQADEAAGSNFELDKTVTEVTTADRTLIGRATVTGQTVPAGTLAARGTHVGITLTRYVQAEEPDPKPGSKLRVPNFIDLTMGQAAAKSEGKLQLLWTTLNEFETQAHPAGTTGVGSQNPVEGTEVDVGSTVCLSLVQYIRKNAPPPPPLRVSVPLLDGTPVEYGKAVLRKAGLNPVPGAISRQEAPTPELAGKTVIVQTEPPANRQVEPGSNVTYVTVTYFAKARPKQSVVTGTNGFCVPFNQRITTFYPDEVTLSADRSTISIVGKVKTPTPAIRAGGVPFKLTDVTLGGVLTDEKFILHGKTLLTYRLTNGLLLQVPEDGSGDGRWKSAQGGGDWSTRGSNGGLDVRFGTFK